MRIGLTIPNPIKAVASRVLSRELSQIAEANETADLLQERIAELELALEDVGWLRFGFEGEVEFSRDGLRKITRLARLMYLKNPLVQRGVNVKRFYVWGQGMTVEAKNEEINEVITDFNEDHKNRVELTSHQARMMKEVELETDGNIFFVLFPNTFTGRVRARTIPFDQIVKVISNPEDAKEPWYYHRKWTERRTDPVTGEEKTFQCEAYYPDWRYQPKGANKSLSIGKVPIEWKSPVYHIRVGGFSDWMFGLSEIYAAIDWARAYKNFLEDVATLMRAYSKFAWKKTTKGGKRGVQSAKEKLESTLGQSGTGTEKNPPPTAGSIFIGTDGSDMSPINVRGASISPDDGRRLLLMVAAAQGLPETFYGDTDVGNLATAKSLDRPTELNMRDRQTFWGDVHRAIYEFQLIWAVKAPLGKLRKLGSVEQTVEAGLITETIQWNDGVDPTISIDFPSILEHDIDKVISSIVKAATLNGQQPAGTIRLPDLARMLLVALGEEDVDKKIEEMFPGGEVPEEAQDEPFIEALKEMRETMLMIQEQFAVPN
ncbi:MAG: hypothetical protein DWQ07_12710 [Chloroflexi bacterium]|nr:MAG: hypothetical protein DWQ07_12710 [Chloroflexota bacterium]MBL1196900.1 hypothetical protein [Chloroflexota bacterium]NOH14196.1 hypothetical protein [Chloroflexota bacterium]